MFAQNQQLHLAGAFVDAQRTDVAVQVLDDLADAHAAATEHLQRHVDDLLGVLGRGELGAGGGGRVGRGARALRGAAVAQPGGAVGEHGRRIDEGTHLAQARLRELEVGQRLAEQAALLRVRHRLGEGTPGHAQRGGGHRGTEDVQRLHGQLETAVDRADQGVGPEPAAVEAQRGQRVRRHHRDMVAAVQAGRAGVDDEGTDAACAGVRVGLGEGEVEVGQATVADPGFAAVQTPAIARRRGAREHARHVGAGLGLAQREGGDLLAARHGRQPGRLLCGCAGQGDGTAAQALHGEGEIGQR